MRFLVIALLASSAFGALTCTDSRNKDAGKCETTSNTRYGEGLNTCTFTNGACVDVAPATPPPTELVTPPPPAPETHPETDAPGPVVYEDGQANGACSMTYEFKEYGNSGKVREEYTPVVSAECVAPLVCIPTNDDGAAPGPGTTVLGTCGEAVGDVSCHGRQKPTFSEGDDDMSNEATIRVTICHRTCSETNPWVRITIDDDAWNGTAASGCGHKLQHNVSVECATKIQHIADDHGLTFDEARESVWGPNDSDYLIKWHGTRDYVRQNAGWPEPICNTNTGKCHKHSEAEKVYWSNWERACPYVRRGHCCGTSETGPCCGPYQESFNPSIKLEKKSGPVHSVACPLENEMGELYTNFPGTMAQYSYEITNTGDTWLCNIRLDDPNLRVRDGMPEHGPFTGLVIDKDNAQFIERNVMRNGCLPPGQSTFAPCHIVPLLAENEMATVTATPSLITNVPIPNLPDVTDTNGAGLAELDLPPIIPCENEGDMTGTMAKDKCPNLPPVVEYLADDSTFGGLGIEGLIPNPVDIFYDMKLSGIDAEVNPGTVKFKVDNPFIFNVDMYVEYRAPPFDVSCAKELDMMDCAHMEPIEAVCNTLDQSFSLVNVYFTAKDVMFDNGTSDVHLYECCGREADNNTNQAMIKLAFKVLCQCPPMSTGRLLRGAEF